MKPRTFIALGSNVGDRRATIRAAIESLDAHARIGVMRVSDLIETAAVDSPAGAGAFLNAAAELSTDLPPRDLLATLLDVERSLGRRRGVRNAPRTIDLDLLLYGQATMCADATLDGPAIALPHPRLHERAFVLGPLCAIAPDVVHPTTGRTVRQMLAALDARDA